ncbi:hypothetical protein HanIR_Chr15g0783051 [Helianthus annuus]|nr:hypothetical protein HanIR_Chr15g0783051 [Helianthus annuus]
MPETELKLPLFSVIRRWRHQPWTYNGGWGINLFENLEHRASHLLVCHHQRKKEVS